MTYQTEATSLSGFVQHVACKRLPSGYYFYTEGRVPPGKDPRATDAKLVSRYGIDISASARSWRKREGLADLHYLRFDRAFLILAGHRQHEFFVKESVLDASGHEKPTGTFCNGSTTLGTRPALYRFLGRGLLATPTKKRLGTSIGHLIIFGS
jgi:hypothetical protein